MPLGHADKGGGWRVCSWDGKVGACEDVEGSARMWRGVRGCGGECDRAREYRRSMRECKGVCKGECKGVCKGACKGVRGSTVSTRKREGVRRSVRECEGVWGSIGGVHARALIGCCEYY